MAKETTQQESLISFGENKSLGSNDFVNKKIELISESFILSPEQKNQYKKNIEADYNNLLPEARDRAFATLQLQLDEAHKNRKGSSRKEVGQGIDPCPAHSIPYLGGIGSRGK